MKTTTIFFSALFFLSCTAKINQPQISEVNIPNGAVKKSFKDNPNLEKVTVTNAAGNILSYGIYKNGLREGSWTELYSNGHVKNITGYVNGLKEGKSVKINRRGQLLECFTYHNGKLEGNYTKYNRSIIKEIKKYKNGLLEGKVEMFYNNGKLMEESYYKNGKRDGIGKWFDQDGNLSIEYTYVDGKWIKDK